MTKSKILILLFLMGLLQSLWAQQEIISQYTDSVKTRTYCLYPSTLRMLDLSENHEFYDVVNNIEKLVIYSLDSTAGADKSYLQMIKDYQETGFEEYMAMYGGSNLFLLYGLEESTTGTFIGVYQQDNQPQAFYLKGAIGWNKIPELFEKFQEGDLLNIFQLNNKKRDQNPHHQ